MRRKSPIITRNKRKLSVNTCMPQLALRKPSPKGLKTDHITHKVWKKIFSGLCIRFQIAGLLLTIRIYINIIYYIYFSLRLKWHLCLPTRVPCEPSVLVLGLSVYLPQWVVWHQEIKSNGTVVLIWYVFLFPISQIWYNLILPLRKISHLLSSFYKTKASWDRLTHVLPMNGVSLKVCLKRIGQTLVWVSFHLSHPG